MNRVADIVYCTLHVIPQWEMEFHMWSEGRYYSDWGWQLWRLAVGAFRPHSVRYTGDSKSFISMSYNNHILSLPYYLQTLEIVAQ
jgi:hypothetical protein